MPRTGPRRELIAVRMLPAAIAVLDQIATDEKIYDERGRPNRSEVVRMLLKEALTARAARKG